MKKQKNYAWLAVLIVFLMAAVPSVLPSVLHGNKAEKKIVKTIATTTKPDCACIPSAPPPCKQSGPLCKAGVGSPTGSQPCPCAAVKNGLCEAHQPKVPTPGGE